LPENIQYAALKKIVGFENAKIIKPGYAIEYDYFPPTQLNYTLETKKIENLYFAGQINGTTGYEEAGAQGLMAGINAHLKIHQKDEFILKRHEAYIGVLIDDLITKGVDEPYRMFTSRAEYRILLRQDNADFRLTPLSYKIGLASQERMDKVQCKKENYDDIIKFIKNQSVEPSEVNLLLNNMETPEIDQKTKLINLLHRPQIRINDLINSVNSFSTFLSNKGLNLDETTEEVEIFIKYESYISKEQEIADKLSKFEDIPLYDSFDYQKLQSLSFEAREKLTKMKPKTIGQASRISGISPSDISVLIVYLGR
jgi:tRNA uridine 5-carboxymethylaminomethyl modification enzyme